jgi:dihydrofolate synthase / folylpolyglutamate synthase
MNYETFFSDLEMFGIKLGLEQTRDLFSRIGNPDKKLRFIHIAGTNGKGSVGAMLASSLSSAGFKTGFYSSPHLISVRERFRIDGKAISKKELEELIKKIKPAIAEIKREGGSPTYFEVTTALAAAHFAENRVDFVIWETGLGGRFDATNIVTPEISIITTIAMDHTAYLGSTLAKIAFEKAGIIKEDIPVFCGVMQEEAERVISERAREMNSPAKFADELKIIKKATPSTSSGQAGGGYTTKEEEENNQDGCPTFQQQNQALARDVLMHLSEQFSFSFEEAISGMSKVKWPGRFQMLVGGTNHNGINNRNIKSENYAQNTQKYIPNKNALVHIIDGAHNPQATKALVSALQEKFPEEKFTILFAAFADKDAENTLKLLAPLAEEFVFTDVKSTRKTCPPERLKKIIKESTNIPVKITDTPASGLKLPRKARLLVTGSLYLVGEVLKELVPESDILDVY